MHFELFFTLCTHWLIICHDISVDGRDTEITKGGHWSSETVLGRRASFMWPEEQLQSTSVGLLLTNINLVDESVYRCRVDFKEAQTKNLLVNLSIIGEWCN